MRQPPILAIAVEHAEDDPQHRDWLKVAVARADLLVDPVRAVAGLRGPHPEFEGYPNAEMTVALWLARLAFRVGDREAIAESLETQARHPQLASPGYELERRWARALADDDIDALVEASAGFDATGYTLYMAETLIDAALIEGRRGEETSWPSRPVRRSSDSTITRSWVRSPRHGGSAGWWVGPRVPSRRDTGVACRHGCPACGAQLTQGARFCAACGTPAPSGCSGCGLELPSGARFCPACGTPVADGTAVAPAGAAAGRDRGRERKTATLLFADIVGFTSLNESHDPELVSARTGSLFERLSREVERYEGTIEKFAGDAMLAVFGVPAAHEDDPERAVRAAIEMQEVVASPWRRRRGGAGAEAAHRHRHR